MFSMFSGGIERDHPHKKSSETLPLHSGIIVVLSTK